MDANPQPPVKVALELADGRTIPADVLYLGRNLSAKVPVWQVITADEIGEVVRLLLLGRAECRTHRSAPHRSAPTATGERPEDGISDRSGERGAG